MWDVYLVVDVCEENFFEVDIIEFIYIFCGYYIKSNKFKEVFFEIIINEDFLFVLIWLLLELFEERVRDFKEFLVGWCEFVDGLYKLIIVKFFLIMGRYFKVVFLSWEYFFYCL